MKKRILRKKAKQYIENFRNNFLICTEKEGYCVGINNGKCIHVSVLEDSFKKYEEERRQFIQAEEDRRTDMENKLIELSKSLNITI